MTVSIIVTTEWTIRMMPPRMTTEMDEANGLSRIMIPAIRSIMPNNSNKNQFGTPFLIERAILMILTLDKIIQIPKAMAKIVGSASGIAIKMRPTTIDKIPEMMPKN